MTIKFKFIAKPLQAMIVLFAIALTCSPAFASPSIKTTSSIYAPGEYVNFTYEGIPAPHAQDWVGLYRADETNTTKKIYWFYTNGISSGSFALEAPEDEGRFKLILFYSGNNQPVAESPVFEVNAETSTPRPSKILPAHLSTKFKTYEPGELVDVSFTAPPACPNKAWAGLFPSDAPHSISKESDSHDISYRYLNCAVMGSLTFVAPNAVGSYDIRLFENDTDGKEIASATFTIELPEVSRFIDPAPEDAGRRLSGERILDYLSEITVHEDSTMTVVEKITVMARGHFIRHGIYRDFPTIYGKTMLDRHITGYKVSKVQRDGKPEEYFTKRLNNGRRLYVGSKDAFVPDGIHTYEITYRTDRQIGRFDDHDELYWNVTGTGWAFPITNVKAIVHLPEGAEVNKIDAFTGPRGLDWKNYWGEIRPDGTAYYTTTYPLDKNHGLTIVAGWPKGVVENPSIFMRVRYFFRDISLEIPFMFSVLVLMAYYLWIWNKVGRDPEGKSIVVRYEPPEGLSPAAMRYLRKMRYDNETLTSAILSLVAKGCAWIDKYEDTYKITTLTCPEKTVLSKGEHKVKEVIGSSVVLKRENHYILQSMKTHLNQMLREEYLDSHIVTNTKKMIPAIAWTVVSLLLGGYYAQMNAGFLIPLGMLAVWGPILYFLIGKQFIALWRDFFRSFRFKDFWSALFWMLPTGMLVATVVILSGMLFKLHWFLAMCLTLSFLLHAVFYVLLKAPTVKGRDLLDEIEGFRRFLKATEENRLNMMNQPERTPELFERYLPYAIALDCENAWGEQFADITDASSMAERYGADSTSRFMRSGSFNAYGFASSLGGTIGSAVSSASVAPGSSGGGSGFSSSGGGGGSSGGGGGGGGGGGW